MIITIDSFYFTPGIGMYIIGYWNVHCQLARYKLVICFPSLPSIESTYVHEALQRLLYCFIYLCGDRRITARVSKPIDLFARCWVSITYLLTKLTVELVERINRTLGDIWLTISINLVVVFDVLDDIFYFKYYIVLFSFH